MGNWHTLKATRVLARLQSRTDGLTQDEVQQRLREEGPNRLAPGKRTSPWIIFLRQFTNMLILVLIGAAGLAWAIGNRKDAVVIVAVVLVNAVLGFSQESKAEQALAALKKMLALKARVRRSGHIGEVPAEDLVPGDIVLVVGGDKVPADGRLLSAASLEVDESTLTGESLPVAKAADALSADDLPPAEQANMIFMNTIATRGKGEMVITATGMKTEMGQLAGLIQTAADSPTPLQTQLDHLGKRLGALAGAIAVLIFVLGLLRGTSLVEILLTSVALAVAAIPEGLPAVVTVTLSMGMYRMAKQRAIVKRLLAVETLGCTTVICSDKTGTLTLNQMTVRAVLFRNQQHAVADGESPTAAESSSCASTLPPDLSPLLSSAVLCNDSHLQHGSVVGDPMEGALLALAERRAVTREALEVQLPRIGEIPFDSTRKYMATFHRDGEAVRMYVKGAPDVLMERCQWLLDHDGEAPLNASAKTQLLRENDAMGARALRVLAFAMRSIAEEQLQVARHDLETLVDNLTFVGLVGVIDPPRPEAQAMIARCSQAGIQVKMITGDHQATAAAIARELGLTGQVLSGVDVERLSAQQLTEQIEDISVFARVSPEHKVKIVNALRRRGHVVAMTGDGVNDAPALKQADIGIAMGVTGTEVSKEAADMVLTDDNFATIVQAVEEGRTIYDNIVKFVCFQLSTNFGALLTVLACPVLGLPLPFSPVQILWINIIMDGPPALALGMDPARPGIMMDPPRSASTRILTRSRMMRLFFYALIMTVGTLGILTYGLHTGDPARALTLAFTTFVFYQVFNVFNARTEYGSAFAAGFFSNWRLWSALGVVVVLQVLIVQLPLTQGIFGTVSLTATDWALTTGVAATILVLEEIREFVVRLRLLNTRPCC